MLNEIVDSARRFLGKPGAADAVASGDRRKALEIFAQPDLEAGAPVVDALLSVEAERTGHVANARQLPELEKLLREIETEISAAADAENARRREFDRLQGQRLAEQKNLLGQHQRICTSPHWLLKNLRPDIAQQVARLAAEAAPYVPEIERLAEAEKQARRAAERFQEQIGKLESGPLKTQAVTRAEIAQLRKNVTIATGRADDFARQLAHARTEQGAILAERDAILDRAKRGEA